MNFLKPIPQGIVGRTADYLMLPVMYLLQGTLKESPQRTHRWNNLHLKNTDIEFFDADKTESVPGDSAAYRRWLGPLPLFHMVIFGGWKKFVVVEPREAPIMWHVGWVAGDAFGLSKIPINGKVRLGIGPGPAQYFGVDTNGRQIDIAIVGFGEIGKANEFAKIPLL